MHDLKFYRDENGTVRAQGADQRLVTFLETDLQSSVEICEELLRLLDNTQAAGEFTGNAHHVTISPKMVTIESSANPDAPDRRLSRAQMRSAVSGWLSYIKQA